MNPNFSAPSRGVVDSAKNDFVLHPYTFGTYCN